MSGVLEILNVGRGDVKISYDTTNAAEAIRAKRIIKDMMKRGYALLVEVEGKHSRVKAFDEAQGEYIIADFDPEGEEEEENPDSTAGPPARKALTSAEKRGMRKDRRVSMIKTKATAIGPTAGG